MSSHPPSPNGDLDRKISASIEAWKRKLLDLTKRNRLLNFKVNAVSTVAVVDEQPTEVFRRLYIAEDAMRFRPTPETETAEADPDANPEHAVWDAEGEEPEPSAEFVPFDTNVLPEKHTDDLLQTNKTREKLDHSLRRLEDQGRVTLEEQGVNTLFLTLGMVHYTESDESEEVYRAPLVLLPIELTRASARSGYEVTAADDEPMVNPALVEHLRHHAVNLPALPDATSMDDDYDLQTLFAATASAIGGRKGWKVTTDIYLGQLSFQKFVMFKDLEKHTKAIAVHRLIHQLVGRTGDHVTGLPAEIRELDLDEAFPPETTFQVVDADSSQLRAMVACQRAFDLVIEGPPGTGKSQTITNLIAQTLAAGKSVLFVAEKMAALNVVHQRLVKAGLGEFCLELHSSKANKRSVMQDLARTIDESLKSAGPAGSAADLLPEVRNTLSEYVQALHEPFGALGKTPFQGYGELGRVRQSNRVPLKQPIEAVTKQLLGQTIRDLGDLAVTAREIGNPSNHPWRDSTKTFYTETDLIAVKQAAENALTAVTKVIDLARKVAGECGLPPILTARDAQVAKDVAAVMARSPGAPLAVLQSDAWNAPPTSATSLVQTGREFTLLKARVGKWFNADVQIQDHGSDIAYVEHKKSGFIGFLAILDGRYRSIAKRWKTYRLPSYTKSILEQANDLKSVDLFRSIRSVLRHRNDEGPELFGGLWRGEDSDWDSLTHYIDWVVEFRKSCVQHRLAEQTMQVATRARPNLATAAELTDALARLNHALAVVQELIDWSVSLFVDSPFVETAARLKELAEATEQGPRWAAFERNRQKMTQGIATDVLVHGLNSAIAFDALPAVFERAFYSKWLDLAVRARPPLAQFHALTHEQRVLEFQDLDQRVLRDNRAVLIQRLRKQAQGRLREPAAASVMPYLRGQMAKQRAISPLRQIMAKAGPGVRALKPCFMMSPVTVAQLLDGSNPSFDLIVFDEASQLPPEDAIGAVLRGNQLVVVGDPKQLPPTNFFAVTTGQAKAVLGEDGTPVYDDAESILEQFMGAGIAMSRLKWHYRSAHESLITFSNVMFYDAELYTFPCTDQPCSGMKFEFVPDGRYEGAGLNATESRRIADAVVTFAREQIQHDERDRLTLGVGTFNMRQQIAIQDELERRRREDPAIEEFFRLSNSEPFFVKNLENIQGDERDVIFLSVTYGPAADGHIRYNFGPLNGQNGWRRLNVLVTRARQHLRVFSSMHGEDINPAAAQSQGPQLLRDFLIYAEHNRLDNPKVSALASAESPFEQEVCAELLNRGYKVISQVGSAGYRIDLGVLDDQMQGRFLCGIECDGVAYHAAETARDRDRLRQQVLEARGWTIHRIWSTDWFRDRPAQIDRLVKSIEQDRVRSQDRKQKPSQAQPQTNPPPIPPTAWITNSSPATAPDYRQPVAAPYIVAKGEGQFTGQDIQTAPISQIVQAIRFVVEAESPVHVMDAYGRVAGFWNKRLGARIQARIEDGAKRAERQGLIRRRGFFFWAQSDVVTVRSRIGMTQAADRIPPVEYEQAVMLILERGHSFERQALINEVRAVLGFSRTGELLQQAISPVIEELLRTNVIGESSTGIKMRDPGL